MMYLPPSGILRLPSGGKNRKVFYQKSAISCVICSFSLTFRFSGRFQKKYFYYTKEADMPDNNQIEGDKDFTKKANLPAVCCVCGKVKQDGKWIIPKSNLKNAMKGNEASNVYCPKCANDCLDEIENHGR